MSVVYVNNFDSLLYSPPRSSSITDLVGSMPAFDPPILVPVPHPVPLVHLGLMHGGSSTQMPQAKIETVPVAIGALHPFQLIAGTVVTVLNAAAGQSRTFYVAPASNAILLSRGTAFRADLAFDQPKATLTGPTGKVWAVGLNFKTGAGATDATTDLRIGVTCQFNDGGAIKFHGTDNKWVDLNPGTYASYSNTEFRLSVTMVVDKGKISGTGTIQYGNNLQMGNLVTTDANGQQIDPSKLTAVGVALATTSGGFNDFGVCLQSFTLSVSQDLS